jgi:hypothetical protein
VYSNGDANLADEVAKSKEVVSFQLSARRGVGESHVRSKVSGVLTRFTALFTAQNSIKHRGFLHSQSAFPFLSMRVTLGIHNQVVSI